MRTPAGGGRRPSMKFLSHHCSDVSVLGNYLPSTPLKTPACGYGTEIAPRQKRRPAMHLIIASFIATLLLTMPLTSQAGAPAADINVQAERILAVLADPQLRLPGQERARRQAVRRVAEDAIDFSETGRRTLGSHWEKRTEAERQT